MEISLLETEIRNGSYGFGKNVVAIFKIVSKVDKELFCDPEKTAILKAAMQEKGILSNEEELLSEILGELLNISEEEAQECFLMLDCVNDEFLFAVTEAVMKEFYQMPENIRKMKNKGAVVEKVLQEQQVDLSYRISLMEYYDTLLGALKHYADNQGIERKVKEYFEQISAYLKFVDDMVKSWCPVHGEVLDEAAIGEYLSILKQIMENTKESSETARKMLQTAHNIDTFFTVWMKKYPEAKTECSMRNIIINPEGEIFDSAYTLINDIIKEIRNNLQNFMKSSNYDKEAVSDLVPAGSCVVPLLEMAYADLLEWLTKRLEENHAEYNEIYGIINENPLMFDKAEYEASFVNHFQYERPYISLHYNQQGEDKEVIGDAYRSDSDFDENGKIVVVVEVHNLSEAYTVSYNILKNMVSDWDESERYVDVNWGNWIDKNKLEVVISKRWISVQPKVISAEIEIYIQGRPTCRGVIKLY